MKPRKLLPNTTNIDNFLINFWFFCIKSPGDCFWNNRPVIKENTTYVVAAHQNNIVLLWHGIPNHTMILWHVMSMELNIGKKIAGLEIMTLNCKKTKHVSKVIELMTKGELHHLQGCFRKHTGRVGVNLWTLNTTTNWRSFRNISFFYFNNRDTS